MAGVPFGDQKRLLHTRVLALRGPFHSSKVKEKLCSDQLTFKNRASYI